MFDARSILDILIGGEPRRQQGRPVDPAVFKDMLDQLGEQESPPAAGQAVTPGNPQQAPGGHWTEQRYPQTTGQPAPGGGAPAGGAGLEDLLRNILGQIQQGQAPAGGGQPAPGGRATGGPEVSKDLQDLLRQILQGGGPDGGVPSGGVKIPVNKLIGETGAGDSEAGGERFLAETLRQVLSQAMAGAREGAAKIDEATGISGKARDALSEATGQSPDEMIARLKELISQNQLAAGAALGGLGALVLGTRAGRSLTSTAIKLGGLALVGGLAYQAYNNYQQGKPPISVRAQTGTGGETRPQTLLPAPDGSGFEAGAITHDAARRYIRAMIAAAAADGRIDAEEQQRILGGLRQSGLNDAARQFLAAEIASPATIAELASGITSPAEALQVYTAGRIAIDTDTPEEHAFLSALADALGIDAELAAQVDATARGESV
ncbi:MAG TPA: DUF533 domain-containing protein [Hyphomicrobiaceae bacterium]|nr:DUF533 domain-containing protein [Hyphomicrobiaceae bacterium]